MKAKPLPRGKLTSLRSKVPRPMQRSGRLPPSATHSVLPFMTASSLACAKREREGFNANRPLGAPLGNWRRRSKLRQAERVCRRPTQSDD